LYLGNSSLYIPVMLLYMMNAPPECHPGFKEEQQQKDFHLCQVPLPAFFISHVIP